MSDQPPADWYTDPEDESQYRYWDGSAWTEHRAPRQSEPDGEPDASPGGLRRPGALVKDSFSLVRRQRRGCAAAAAVSIAGQIALLALALIAANEILMGELGEIWGRINETGFDPEAPEHKTYFESLELDLSFSNLALIAVGLIIAWVTNNLMKAAVLSLSLADVRGRTLSASEAMSRALGRVLRLMGLDLQVMGVLIAALVPVVVVGAVVPVLLILLIPAWVAAAIMATAVISMAYVFAATGPAGSSLLYGVRLVRGRFWGSLGRLLVVFLVIIAVSVAVGLAFGGTSAAATQLWLPLQLIQTVLGVALTVFGIAATAILYHDLGGESD